MIQDFVGPLHPHYDYPLAFSFFVPLFHSIKQYFSAVIICQTLGKRLAEPAELPPAPPPTHTLIQFQMQGLSI